MFYVKSFFQCLLKAPIQGLLFFTLGVALVCGFSQKNKIERTVFKSLSKSKSPYFYALISNKKNYNSVSRKLGSLPGVKNVNVLSQERVRKEASKILGSANLDLASELSNIDYAALKITFVDKIQSRSQNLIRDYLERLVGKSNLTLGSVRGGVSKLPQKKIFLMFLYNWGIPVGLVVFGLIWMILGYSMDKTVSSKAYVIEQFQRKKGVAFKMMATGSAIIFSLGLLISFLIGKPQLTWMMASVIPFIFVSCLFISNKEWQN